MTFAIKRIRFFNSSVPIILQNENGPCPLIAICNVLLLRKLIVIHEDLSEIDISHLITLVADILFESNDQRATVCPAMQESLDGTLSLLPMLEKGLDVNIQFVQVKGFEFTRALGVFDALDIDLLHGWICDPEDTETASILRGLSYNSAVERLCNFQSIRERATSAHIEEKCFFKSECVMPDPCAEAHTVEVRSISDSDALLLREGKIIEDFMQSTANQLTFCGLAMLHETMRERQLACFFRNNHFSTIFKLEGCIYLLVTDEGYRDEDMIIWEKIDTIDGDTEYVNGSFEIPHKLLIQRHANEVATSIPNLVDPDFLLAVHISQTDLLQVQSSTESVDAMSRRERSDPTSVPDLNVESSSCLPVCDPLASDSEFASSLQKSFDGELKGNHSRSTENPHLFYSGQICETDLEYAQLFQKQLNCEQSANLERHHSETSVDADALFAHLLHQQLNNDQSALFSESNPGDARTIANGKRPSDKNKRQERESEKNGCKLQ